MNLRSPLGRVLGLGSAKDGTSHWWAQRMTAIALIFLGIWFLASLLLLEDLRFEVMSSWMARPMNGALLILSVATLAYHSKLGVQVVIEDYVHGPAIKVVSLVTNGFAHGLLAVAGMFAVLKIAFGVA